MKYQITPYGNKGEVTLKIGNTTMRFCNERLARVAAEHYIKTQRKQHDIRINYNSGNAETPSGI
jgi:hypothetical protein